MQSIEENIEATKFLLIIKIERFIDYLLLTTNQYTIMNGEFISIANTTHGYATAVKLIKPDTESSSNGFNYKKYLKAFRFYADKSNKRLLIRLDSDDADNLFLYFNIKNAVNKYEKYTEIPFIFSVYYDSFEKNNLVVFDDYDIYHEEYQWVLPPGCTFDIVYNINDNLTLLGSDHGDYIIVNREKKILYYITFDETYKPKDCIASVWTDEHGNICVCNSGDVSSYAYFII